MKLVALCILVVLVGLACWQQLRYLNARRGPVQDEQPLLYGRSVFHVLSLVRAAEGTDVIESLRKLRGELEATGQARVVYAGRSVRAGLQSAQLGENEWDAAILVQHPSRQAYDAIAASAGYRAALERFAATYSHGLDRPVLMNLGIPLMLGALRVRDLVRRTPARHPFEPASPEQLEARPGADDGRFLQLDSLREYSEDAVVVINLLKGGSAEQQAADRGYGLQMAGLFAENTCGPMHAGRAVTLEGDARFDNMVLVYYPGIDFMKSMLQSSFFNGIVGGKQPGDTLALPTVPILSRL
jgi:uncharacterized protein (DUF1330 family)